MVNLKKSQLNSISNRVKNILHERIQQEDHLILGLSGGVDSVVLLNILISFSLKFRFTLTALHVNHGISPNAEKWENFCLDLCSTHNIPIKLVKLKINKLSGISPEANARYARYKEFENLKADYVILAQHLDDQAETLLLQMIRGAGVKGLSAMPVIRDQIPRDGDQGFVLRPQILRPLLNVSRNEIEDYAREYKLSWVKDESNNDISFSRNFLRHKIFPLLETKFPAYRTTFLRTSHHMAEANSLLDDLARLDSKKCIISDRIEIRKFQELNFLRAKNLLRYDLVRRGMTLPSTAKLEDMIRQLFTSKLDTKLHIIFGDNEIRTYRGSIYVKRAHKSPNKELKILWNGEKKIEITEKGDSVRFLREKGKGINLQKLKKEPIIIRFRSGGERMRPDFNRPRRSLKNLFQEKSLPQWERESLPLLFSGEHLVWAPGIGIDCAFQARDSDLGLIVSWHPNTE
ncbi:MAG: tRNA lysidine(34) synthetase TilS [Nitrosomonadaceae bacterium]|nr:tRNA lysidine(34) synthetase TilS [Nitrosomonadaceae bacterium]|tara:strand:+ start:16854 stop:18233 length:1380 start_codon:yes stop_codon:yes gene_type:complete